VGIGDAEYQRAVKAAVNEAAVVWLIVDIIDFAGSFTPQLVELAGGKPLVVVANKVDLLPERAIRSETRSWVQAQVPVGVRVALTSSRTGEGIRDLLAGTRALSAGRRSESVKVAVIGVTNTGKSSLTGKLLSAGGRGIPPTISKFPGTTLGILRRSLPENGLELLDTPGVIPPGRVSDLLCEECLKAVIPARGVSTKLFGLTPGQSLLLGGLSTVQVKEVENGPEVSW
jgi:ribosome biogenesis GTPase A